jgi:hypothetical protein
MRTFAELAAQKAAPAAAKVAGAATPAPAGKPSTATLPKRETPPAAPATKTAPPAVKTAPPAKPAAFAKPAAKTGMESLAEEQAMTSYDFDEPVSMQPNPLAELEAAAAMTSPQSLTQAETDAVLARIAKVRELRQQGQLGISGIGATSEGGVKREGGPGQYGGVMAGLRPLKSLPPSSQVMVGGKPQYAEARGRVAIPSKAEMGAPADFQRVVNSAGAGYKEATSRLLGIGKERDAKLKAAMQGELTPSDPGYDAERAARIAASVDRDLALRRVQALRDQAVARSTLKEYGVDDDEIESMFGAASAPETPIPFK